MASIEFAGFLYDDAGDAINGATVNLYDRNTVTPVRATTTTSSAGYYSITHGTEGRFDIEFVSGSSKRRVKFDNAWQMQELELANLLIRNPANTYKYNVVPAAITADRNLTLPLITTNDTLACLGLAQAFTTRQLWAKGSDLSSGSTITPGTDGNFFDITGTTTITAIATLQAGSVVVFQFDAALTLTHNGTSLILQGAQNVTTVAGDIFAFISEGSGNWRELFRRPAHPVTGLTALAAGPAATDEVYISDNGVSKRIDVVELLNPENFTACTLPAAADELFINDNGDGKKITHDDLLFGASGTPSTQAHDDSAAKGSALDAARSDHKHAMPSGGGAAQANQAAVEGETNEDTYVPPDLIKHSPGVAKAWLKWEQTDTHGIEASYNVTQVDDGSGVGDSDIVWDTDFSSANYVLAGMVQSNGTLGHSALATTGCTVLAITVEDQFFDGIDNMIVAFGDQ